MDKSKPAQRALGTMLTSQRVTLKKLSPPTFRVPVDDEIYAVITFFRTGSVECALFSPKDVLMVKVIFTMNAPHCHFTISFEAENTAEATYQYDAALETNLLYTVHVHFLFKVLGLLAMNLVDHQFDQEVPGAWLRPLYKMALPSPSTESVSGETYYIVEGNAFRVYHRNYSVGGLTQQQAVYTQLSLEKWPERCFEELVAEAKATNQYRPGGFDEVST